MPQTDAFVGIDVAKAELVIHLHPAGRWWRVANDKAGLAMLGRKLVRLAAAHRLRIGLEASGGYERPLLRLADRLGLDAWLLDPARVRSFGRAERKLAKTDPLDAALIARCLAALHSGIEPYRHDPAAERLAEHVRTRDALVGQATQLSNQLETLADRAMRKLVAAQLARLRAAILTVEKAIAVIIADSADLLRRERLLRSAPGVGPIVAAGLIARMPELGRLSSRQIAALAGLAPFDRQSGAGARPAHCSGGRGNVRRLLYLAALAIARSGKGPLAAACQRLRNAGKPAKLALVATARRLLVTLNAMLKHDTPYAHS